ncbi:PREDICTED: serine protease gd-like isoform X2 [Vollenhovia emeryi]|uniref:serine protease gd-like isoform X2 n=1 Tax=Vollenhovia emeryi TaxID=411798 RepID=UPI0005F3D32C|nr:PREDICTED: serine protease gd-like isoform X2 [Vollenhovia emeryi]
MSKIFILFALLPQLLCTMVHGTMLCSKYFTYTIHPETLKIVGRIEIPSPPDNDEMLYLKVALNTTTYSLQGLFRLELARPIKETIRAIQQGRPLLYHINFPLAEKFPTLSAIWFNNQEYCFGAGASSENIVSNIELGHYVYPPDKEPLPQDFQPWHRNSSGYRIDNPYYNRNTKCGVTSYYTDSTNRLIPNAGHCMKENLFDNTTLHSSMLEVRMGRFNLYELRGNGSANRKVASYVVHPDYAHYLQATSDLAVLTLKNVVEFNPLIKPICLWSGLTQLEDVISRTGYVVGWGEDALNHRDVNEQRMVRATIVSHETCLWTDARFFSFVSDNTFCAGNLDIFSPCNGDSGNGLILLNNITGSYELRGVVSRTVVGETTYCDPQKYVVYVDVAKYIPWIQRYIST